MPKGKKFEGVLAEPMEESEDPDIMVDATFERLDALGAHYGRDWEKEMYLLLLDLAADTVPGFRVKNTGGRPPSRKAVHDDMVIFDALESAASNDENISAAARKFAKQWSESGREVTDGYISSRYYKIKEALEKESPRAERMKRLVFDILEKSSTRN
jgi:hypothetical protein